MELDLEKLTKKLADLDKKAEEPDKVLQNVRLEINNVLWDLVEVRKDDKKDR